MHQQVDDDRESPTPSWIDRTEFELCKELKRRNTTSRHIKMAIMLLGAIEAEEFIVPIPKVNEVTGRISFTWPASLSAGGAIIITVLDKPFQCVINYERNFGLHTQKCGGPLLIRQELLKLYPFLKMRWDRNTLQ